MSLLDSFGITNGNPLYNQLVSDPRYLAATPAFARSVHDILFNYGFQPTAQQTSDYGVGAIEDNPYSVANLLVKGHTNADHASENAANNAGLAESGAAVGALNANNEAYKENYAKAQAAASGQISSALAGYGNTVGTIFDTLEQQPAQQAITPQAPIASGTPSGAGTGLPTPQQPYQRSGPEAGWVSSKLIKPKIMPIGQPGGMGHIT